MRRFIFFLPILITMACFFSVFYVANNVLWLQVEFGDRILICLGCLLVVMSIAYLQNDYLKKFSNISRSIRYLAMLSLLVVGMGPLRQVRSPDGDSPHYLTATTNLLKTGSFLGSDGYSRRYHIPYSLDHVEVWELPDKRLAGNVNGETQFFYSILLPLLSAPFAWYKPHLYYFLFHSIFIFLALCIIWMIGGKLKIEDRFVAFATTPIILFTAQPYPDSLAFILTSIALWGLIRHRFLLLGFINASLLWAKPVYVIIAAFMTIQAIWTFHLWRTEQRSKFIQLSFPLLASFLGLCFYNYFSWGSFTITANYGSVGAQLNLKYLSSMLPRFFFSPSGGLFWAWPFFLYLFTGKTLLRIFRNREQVFLLLGSLGFIFIIGTNGGESGWCPRARYFLPIAPIFLYLLTVHVKRLNPFLMALSILCLLISTLSPQGNLPWSDLNSPFSLLSASTVFGAWTKIPYKTAMQNILSQHIDLYSRVFFIGMLTFSLLDLANVLRKERNGVSKKTSENEVTTT